MLSRRIGTYACCALLMSQLVGSAEEIDRSLRDKFLEAMRQVPWKSERVSFRVKCVATGYRTVSDAERARLLEKNLDPDKRETETRIIGVRGPFVLTTNTNRGIEYVRASNDKYAFEIYRASGATTYTLSALEEHGGASLMRRRIQREEEEARSLPFAGWYLSDERVASVCASPTFRFKRVAQEVRDGSELVRIEFERPEADRKRRAWSYTDGFLLCDPTKQWALIEYGKTSFDGFITSRHVLTYAEPSDGLPIPTTIARDHSRKDEDGVEQKWGSLITIEVLDEDVPREEFYLSHYGLPEPNFRRGWFGAWVWYLLVGAVCLAIGAILLKRRQARG